MAWLEYVFLVNWEKGTTAGDLERRSPGTSDDRRHGILILDPHFLQAAAATAVTAISL
jgi:hypothetical protein